MNAIVPRSDLGNSLGTVNKRWNEIHVKTLAAEEFSGAVKTEVDAKATKIELARVEGEIAGATAPRYYAEDIAFSGNKTIITTPNILWININNQGFKLSGQQTININDPMAWDTGATAWVPEKIYAVGEYVLGTDAKYIYKCKTAGKSSTLTPVWPTAIGATYNDGSIVWECALNYATTSNRAGKDFYIYAQTTNALAPSFILSLNSTVPEKGNASTTRKVGGFHCLCTDVGVIAGHTLTGYVAGDILPASVWDLKHRPICSPEGMAFIDGMNIWMGIYLLSSSGTVSNRQLTTINNGVIADGTSTITWNDFDFIETLGKQRMRLPSDDELTVATQGNPQAVAISGAADPNTTGGHISTSNVRLISNYGIEDGCGVMWQWTRGYFYTSANVRGLFGGSWGNGASCGSRYLGNSTVGTLYSADGARAASEPLAV